MQMEQLNLKLQKPLFQEIDIISRVLHIPRNEWARNILAHEAKKELEEHQKFLVQEYVKGNITRLELVNILGEPEVKNIDQIMMLGKKSFEDAKWLAKTMRYTKSAKYLNNY